MPCDFCNADITADEIVVVGRTDMASAVRAGYNPFASGRMKKLASRIAVMAGSTLDDVYRDWRTRALASNTDWGLCPACANAFRKATPRSAGRIDSHRNHTGRDTQTPKTLVGSNEADTQQCADYRAKTGRSAISKLKKKVTGRFDVIGTEVLQEGTSRDMTVEAFDQQQARNIAKQSLQHQERITRIKECSPPARGFLGFGKAPGVFKCRISRLPLIRVTYAYVKSPSRKRSKTANTECVKGDIRDRAMRPTASRAHQSEVAAAVRELRALWRLPTAGLSPNEVYSRQISPVIKVGKKLSTIGGTQLMSDVLQKLSKANRQLVSYAWDGCGGYKCPDKARLQRQGQQLIQQMLEQMDK